MRFPKTFIDDLRNQADILRVVGDFVSLKKKGNNYWACCPFHHEKTPSFAVNPSKGLFKCFGCGKGGNVFDFVMEVEGSSFFEAVKTIAEKSGVALPAATDSREMAEKDRQRAELLQINQWATEFFEQTLIETSEGRRALDYLAERGVNEETRKAFRLGYAPNSWDALGNFLRSRGATRPQIERSGLVSVKDSGAGSYDRFRGRLMFPISDTQGRVIAFGGRILGEGEPKYLNSPETAVYTKGQHLFGLSHSRDQIRLRGYGILVEGYLDFLIPFQFGVKNLVASLGTALTENQVRLLARYARKIIVNFDPDAAGVAATKRSLEMLLAEGFKVNVLTLPDNLDPDEFIRARGADGYYKLLKHSQNFLDYIVAQAISANDQSHPRGKVETINAILPYLRLVKDRIERAEQFEHIADRLKIDGRYLREEFKKAAETRQERVSERTVMATVTVKPAERRLLEILLSFPPLRRRLSGQMREEDYAGLRTERLFHALFAFERQGIEPTYAALTEGLDDEELARDLLPQLMITDFDNNSSSRASLELVEQEAIESLHSLREKNLGEKTQNLQAEIKEAQRAQASTDELIMQKLELAKQKFKGSLTDRSNQA